MWVCVSLVACVAILVLFLALKQQKVRELLANCERVEKELAHSKQLNEASEQNRHNVELENAALRSLADQREKQLFEKDQQISDLDKVKSRYIDIQARFQEKEEQIRSSEKLLEESKSILFKEFELAAGKLFDSKQRNFTETSRQNIENVLSPFKTQLKEFHKHVDELYSNENAQRNQLIGQIGELQKQTLKIGDDANNLAQALKGDNKVQGQWGEVVLERILEQSGLEKGREYRTQITLKNELGKTYRPDVIIHLPESKDIIIDSKVALVDYERYSVEERDELKKQYLKSHVDAIRAHIKSLSTKSYENLEGLRSLDFVFMFIPIETAYVAAIQNTPTLFAEAQEKNIMLVSPSSLMVALRTVETMWRYEKQNANAEKIAASAGKLYDQFVLIMTSLEDLGGYLNKAGESYETVFNRISKGRGNMLKKIEGLKKLGAKTSKVLPKETQKRVLENEEQIAFLLEDED